jgi:hypothetical protein
VRRIRLLLFALLAALAVSCGHFRPAPGPPPPAVSAPDWDRAFTRASGWTGGDVAASAVIPGGRMLWLFGDSFVGEVKDGRRVNPALVNNAIGIQSIDPARPERAPQPDELDFIWGPDDAAGQPTAWVRPAQADGSWYWPTGGAAVIPDPAGEHLAVFLIRLTKTAGAASVWAFQVASNDLAMIDNPESPARAWRPRLQVLPEALTRLPDPGGQVEWGVAVLALGRPAWVYVYGVDTDSAGGRGLVLARARADRLEDFGQWEFFAGGGRWSRGIAGAGPLIEGVATELSVERIDHADGPDYVMVMSEAPLGARILVRRAHRPEGPWSEPVPAYQVAGLADHPDRFTYAAKGHAAMSPAGSLLISYIVNSNDLVDLADAALYRPRFILAPLATTSP